MKLAETITHLKNGWCVCKTDDYSAGESDLSLTNDDGDTLELHHKVFEALLDRNLLEVHLTHSVIQPDIDSVWYQLKNTDTN